MNYADIPLKETLDQSSRNSKISCLLQSTPSRIDDLRPISGGVKTLPDQERFGTSGEKRAFGSRCRLWEKSLARFRNRYTWYLPHHGLRPTKSTENIRKHHRSNELGLFVTQPTSRTKNTRKLFVVSLFANRIQLIRSIKEILCLVFKIRSHTSDCFGIQNDCVHHQMTAYTIKWSYLVLTWQSIFW